MQAVTGTVRRADQAGGPLRGTVVLDFGQTAVGPVSAMFLGYLGATVIKVEQPRGDLARFDTSRKGAVGFTFLSANLGKYGVVLDLKDPGDYASCLALIARADVLVENFRTPDVMRRLGLDYFDVLAPTNPRLVYLQAASFQGRGPWKDFPSFEWVAQAASGFCGSTGAAGGKPEFSRGTAYLDWTGAMVNTIAVLAGLYRRHTTGEGGMLSTSQFGTSVFAGSSRLAEYLVDRSSPARLGHDFGVTMLDRAFATADGYLALCAPTAPIRRRLAATVGLPADSVEPTGAELEPILKAATTDTWLARFRAARVPCGALGPGRTVVEALRADAQSIEEGLLCEFDAGRGGVLYATPPWRIVDLEPVTPRPAPELGEHDAVVKMLLEPVAAVAPTDRSSPGEWTMTPLAGSLPLAGVNLLEIGTGLAIGTAGMVLAQLGATVTKVVPPGGDVAIASTAETAALLARQLHAGKAVEHLDLRRRADRARVDELASGASAVVVAGPMRVRRAFRLDVADLRAVRDDIVYCGLTGYGTTGPLADAPATELGVQLASGMTRQVGRRSDAPVRQGFHLASVNTGYAAAQALVAGLLVPHHRDARGRHFEVSLLRTGVVLNGWGITAESGADGAVGKQINGYDWPPDHGYTCKDRQVLISLRNNDEGWVRFFVALGRVDLLADERFNTLACLRDNEWLLPALLEETTARFTSDELAAIVESVGGTLVPILDPHEVLVHPQVLAQQLMRPGGQFVDVPIHLVTR